MEFKLCTTAEKVPPPGEDVIVYEIENGHINDVWFDRIEIQVCPSDELYLVSDYEHPNFIWGRRL